MPQKFPLNFREETRNAEGRTRISEGKGEEIIIAPSFIPDPENYIGIPQCKVVIAKRESLHGHDFEGTLEAIKSQNTNFFMPPIAYWTRHFFNVQEAAQGKRELYDGAGNPLSLEEAKNHWLYYTTKSRDQFGSISRDKVCCSWINAKFVKGSGFNGLDLQTFNVPNYPATQPLEVCLWKDKYVVLDAGKFNKQGLPIPDIQTQDNYSEGQNIYFYYPKEDCVAGVWADSGWAGLGCDRSPAYRDDALGVFVCAEGAARKNWGVK